MQTAKVYLLHLIENKIYDCTQNKNTNLELGEK